MALLDKITGRRRDKKPSKKEENVLDLVKEDKKQEKVETPAQPAKENTGRAHHILRRYHLSEKSNLQSADGRYVFVVNKNANKIEIRKAVENVYDVHVTNVNIVSSKGKNRRMGRVYGRTSDWKKAYVTLRPGEKISGLAEGI